MANLINLPWRENKMIIFEGLDATGKSTLAKYVAQRVLEINKQSLTIQGSEGPAKSSEEIHDRIDKYAGMTATIFDRHPVVSQGIYTLVHHRSGEPTVHIRSDYLIRFYETRNLFIYCDPITDVSHDGKPGENARLIETIQEYRWELLVRYRSWAMRHAHVIYRVGMDMEIIVKLVSNCLDRL